MTLIDSLVPCACTPSNGRKEIWSVDCAACDVADNGLVTRVPLPRGIACKNDISAQRAHEADGRRIVAARAIKPVVTAFKSPGRYDSRGRLRHVSLPDYSTAEEPITIEEYQRRG